MSEMFDFKNYQWRKMAKNGDGEFAFSICQIRHFAIGPPVKSKKMHSLTQLLYQLLINIDRKTISLAKLSI